MIRRRYIDVQKDQETSSTFAFFDTWLRLFCYNILEKRNCRHVSIMLKKVNIKKCLFESLYGINISAFITLPMFIPVSESRNI